MWVGVELFLGDVVGCRLGVGVVLVAERVNMRNSSEHYFMPQIGYM